MPKTNNVTYGKPAVSGAVSIAPVGTTLPKDAKEKLEVAFKNLGYISEDGFTNTNSPETDSIKAWGGDTVLVLQTSKDDTFATTFIESLNINVLKLIYGDENVTGDLATGIKVKANAKPQKPYSFVVDQILAEGALKRIVIPSATITELGEIVYKDDEPVGYETTLQATPDKDGNTHFEYIIKE